MTDYKINHLNVLEVRKVDFCPPYFETLTIAPGYNLLDVINDWIYTNLKGKYYIGQTVGLNKEDAIVNVLKIGFENKKEMSYFMLACPHLKYS